MDKKKKNPPGAYVPAVYARNLGPSAAILLGQIVFWHAKLNDGKNRYIVPREGFRWLAHTHQQLADETGLSVQSVKGGIRRLKAKGIIHSEQHIYRNIVPCHIRFREDCPDWVGEGLPPEWSIGRLLGLAENDNPYLKGETNFKTKVRHSAPSAPPSTKFIEKKKQGDMPADKPGIGEDKKVGPGVLADIFRAAWAAEYPTVTLVPFDTKDLGQFKNIIEKCPPGQAIEVVDHAVRHWGDFISHAVAMQGAFNLPQRPSVGHLLRFVGSAVNVYREHLKFAELLAKKKELASAKKVMACATKPQTPEPEVDKADKPATLEEVAKILGYEV